MKDDVGVRFLVPEDVPPLAIEVFDWVPLASDLDFVAILLRICEP